MGKLQSSSQYLESHPSGDKEVRGLEEGEEGESGEGWGTLSNYQGPISLSTSFRFEKQIIDLGAEYAQATPERILPTP